MEIVLAVMALLFVTMAGLTTVAVVRTKRAVQRGIERHAPVARRMVEDTTLRARRLAQPGAAGQLAELRLSLRTSLDSTRRTLQAASGDDGSLGEALALCARLEEHGRALDTELKQLEREPDRARAGDRLPELRERAERITHSADSLRWAAQDRARQFADEELADLSRQCDLEAGALRHWTPPTVAAAEPRKAVPGAKRGPGEDLPGAGPTARPPGA